MQNNSPVLPNEQKLHDAETAFRKYVDSFRSADGSLIFPMQAKLDHTFEVCSIADSLASHERFTRPDLHHLAALFHDVSRFEQIQIYHTFFDAKSFDHGTRSSELILEHSFLQAFSEEEQKCVSQAILVHNKYAIPDNFPKEYLEYAKALRDADKLAILCLLIRFFSGTYSDTTISLDLPDTPGFSPQICSNIRQGKCVRYTDMKCVNDFKLGLFAWLYDLNFISSIQYVHERSLFEQILNFLPKDEPIVQDVSVQAFSFISSKLNL